MTNAFQRDIAADVQALSSIQDAIAISWETHRRTRGLCDSLGLRLYELDCEYGRLRRYLSLCHQTLQVLGRNKPKVVIVQNPSIVLAIAAVLLRSVYRYRLVVDAHNEAITPFINTKWPVPAIARWLQSRADMTIVTNEELGAIVRANGGQPHILFDALPSPPIARPMALPPRSVLRSMVISTYAPDEPLRELLSAASRLGSGYQFHVTGRSNKLRADERSQVPINVTLTGYLDEQAYWELMSSSDLVIDLTLMPDCLVCGAYEALAMHKPMVLSDSAASRRLFGEVAVMSAPTAADIVRAVREARERLPELLSKMQASETALIRRWQCSAAELRAWIGRSNS